MLRKLKLVNVVASALLCIANFAISLSFFYQRRYVSAALVAGLAVILDFATSHLARQTDIQIAKRIAAALKEILGWSYALFTMVGVPFALYINHHPILLWTYLVLVVCGTVAGFRKRMCSLRPNKLKITQAGVEYVRSPVYVLEMLAMMASWVPEKSFYELLIYTTAIRLSGRDPASLKRSEKAEFDQFVAHNLATIRAAIDRIKISQPAIQMSEENWEKASGLVPSENSGDAESAIKLDALFPTPSDLPADDSSLHFHPDETCATAADESQALRILVVNDEPAINYLAGLLASGATNLFPSCFQPKITPRKSSRLLRQLRLMW